MDYGNLYFQVEPFPGAEGYAWTFTQNDSVLLDTFEDEGRLTDAKYRIPYIVSRNKKFMPGELQV